MNPDDVGDPQAALDAPVSSPPSPLAPRHEKNNDNTVHVLEVPENGSVIDNHFPSRDAYDSSDESTGDGSSSGAISDSMNQAKSSTAPIHAVDFDDISDIVPTEPDSTNSSDDISGGDVSKDSTTTVKQPDLDHGSLNEQEEVETYGPSLSPTLYQRDHLSIQHARFPEHLSPAPQDSESFDDQVALFATDWRRKKAEVDRTRGEMSELLDRLLKATNELIVRTGSKTTSASSSIMASSRFSDVASLGSSRSTTDGQIADLRSLQARCQKSFKNYKRLQKELEQKEERFSRRLRAHDASSDADSEQASDFPADVPEILQGISWDGPPEDLHPLYRQLAFTVGDLESAYDESLNLQLIKRQYEYDVEMRERFTKRIPEYNSDFGDDYSNMEREHHSRIDRLTEQVEHLKHVCGERGVMRQHMPFHMLSLLYPDESFDDIDLDDRDTILGRQNTLTHRDFPELLSRPDHLLASPDPMTADMSLRLALESPSYGAARTRQIHLAAQEVAIDELVHASPESDAKPVYASRLSANKMDLVNRWIVHSLRISPLNALLLWTIYTSKGYPEYESLWRWQLDALWFSVYDPKLYEEWDSVPLSSMPERPSVPEPGRSLSTPSAPSSTRAVSVIPSEAYSAYNFKAVMAAATADIGRRVAQNWQHYKLTRQRSDTISSV